MAVWPVLWAKCKALALGDVAQSWVRTGENKAVDPAQLTQALWPKAMLRIGAKAGLSAQNAPNWLAQVLHP